MVGNKVDLRTPGDLADTSATRSCATAELQYAA